MLTTELYNLHTVSIEKFHEESVCHKVEGVAANTLYGNKESSYQHIICTINLPHAVTLGGAYEGGRASAVVYTVT